MTRRSARLAVPATEGLDSSIFRRHGQVGAALVEFVVVFAFVLMPLMFSVWEFGRIFDAWLVSTNAAREGARYGVATNLTGPDFETYVRDKVNDYVVSGYGPRLGLGDVQIPPSNITIEELPGGDIRVIVSADVDIWAPIGAALSGGGPFTVTAWSTMRR